MTYYFFPLTGFSSWDDMCADWINNQPKYNYFNSVRHTSMITSVIGAMKRYRSNYGECDEEKWRKITTYIHKQYIDLICAWNKYIDSLDSLLEPMEYTEYWLCLIFGSIVYDTFYSKTGYPLYPPRELDTTTKYWKDPNRMCYLSSKIVWES